MTSVTFGISGALAVAALGVCTLLGFEGFPKIQETPGQYAGRLWERGSNIAEEVYLQAVLLLPGSGHAVVKPAPAPGSAVGATPGSAKSPVEEQDTLKQKVAADESQINAQQEVSVKRYKEALKDSGPEEPLLMPEQADDVRARMPAIDPAGPEMRCGQAIPAHSSLTTRNIELKGRSIYQGKHGGEHAWKYVITFINHGKETVQMLTRHWVFVDANGKLESEVKGPGARGVTPVLPPGGEWNYESGASIPTSMGSMHGSFQFEVLKGAAGEQPLAAEDRSFSARVGRLLLWSGKSGAKKEAPCVDEASSELMPLTSVLSVERVILGGRSEAAGTRKKKKGSDKPPEYLFHYDVQFNNARDSEVEIVAHRWEVVDANGARSVVSEGHGVGGRMGGRPRPLAAGDAFRVQGELRSPTPEANAQGTFKVIIKGDSGTFREIEARTDYFGLAARGEQTHVPNFVADPKFR